MKVELESGLERWVAAQILDADQAARIRQWESERVPEGRSRWQVVVALVFGGLMLAAGVLLFVSAHWDELSPVERMTLLVGAVGGLHVAGALVRERFHALGTTLHAVGSVALGGAIALAGQIFNMEEHWPAAVLMWATGAVLGWFLLRDWPHAALAGLLIPWWLVGEFTEAARSSWEGWRVANCGILLLAICYLSVRTTARESYAHVALAWLGGIALLPAAIAVSLSQYRYRHEETSTELIWVGWAGALLLPLAFAWLYRREGAWINGLAAIWVVALNFAAQERLEALVYAWCAIGAAGMVMWGVHEARTERINLGMAGFALSIACFFFSNVMDKLGRSASLIVLGTLFLGGGWYWEKLRRRLVAGVTAGGVA